MGIITLGVAAASLAVFLPIYRLRFGLGWAKALLFTIITWFALNTIASVILTVFSI